MEAVTPTVELDGQYRALREGCGLLDRSERAHLIVAGSDSVDFLQGQLTNDIEALAPGAGCYAALLDRKGGVQADMRVLRIGDQDLCLDMEPEGAEVVARHLSTYKIGRQVEIGEPDPRRAILSLLGPRSSAVAGIGPLAPEHAHRELEVADVRCRVVATDVGLDLVCAETEAQAVAEAVVASGAERVSERATEIIRVESGRPRFGREIAPGVLPQEAGIDARAVSFTKGCYIGQETVARLHYRGKPNRHLRGLRLQAQVADGELVVLEGRELGRIGTAVVSPANGPIALAVIRREAAPGARVAVGADGAEGEVVELPFSRID
jgi:folate-binding protein YgfZ